ncbi:MAG: ATP-binding protein [Paludibacteraceae bacterium]|nr:ATP-binding protein [Paludibacteraceae bacterium]
MRNLETILADQRQELIRVDCSTLLSRQEEQKINLHSKLAQVVIGVRRSGKSVLCQKVLLESGVRFAYVNFDDENLADMKVDELNEIIETLYRIYGNYTHLFIDEVQNAPRWPLFVNRLLRQGLHLIITGSNANLLSDELITHLTGRYNEIRLFPFSFEEYCRINKVDTHGQYTKAIGLRGHVLGKYLMDGGFPETMNGSLDKTAYTKALLETIIKKDICKRYKVRYPASLRQVADTTIDNFCQEINFENIRETYAIRSVQTVKNYISYLSNAYLIRILHKFSFKSKERQSNLKTYTIDNAFLSNRDNALQPENLGWRLENCVAIELLRRQRYADEQLYYLRESNRYEVDFVRTQAGKVLELIQVTYDFRNPSTKLFNREVGGLIKAAEKTHCDNLTLIALYGEAGTVDHKGKTIRIVNAADWLIGRSE